MEAVGKIRLNKGDTVMLSDDFLAKRHYQKRHHVLKQGLQFVVHGYGRNGSVEIRHLDGRKIQKYHRDYLILVNE